MGDSSGSSDLASRSGRPSVIIACAVEMLLGCDMFIMRRVDQREAVDVVGPALDAYNKVHAGKRIKVEWGVGGLKAKWRILSGTWTNRRQKFANDNEGLCDIN